MENQREKWTAGQIAVWIRMYPEDKHKRLSIACRLAKEFPAILADLGEEKARPVRLWLESQGVQVDPITSPHRDSWAEVARLLWRYWKHKPDDFTPLEVVRVLVWSAMGFKP